MASALSFFSGSEQLEDVNHARGLIKELKSLYDAQLLADVTIGVEADQEVKGDIAKLFRCNRNILAAASPYFKSMFTGGLDEGVQKKVIIHGVDAESMSVIVDYCYTGSVTITEGNVQRLYAAANMLHLEYIRQACSSFMTRRLDLSNCVGILKFADTYDNPELKAKAQAFIARNFGQICNGRELCELDFVQMREVLSLDTLDVDCERKVCSAALQWIAANIPEGSEDVLQVLGCVRWKLFTDQDKAYLESLVARPVIEKYLAHFINKSTEENLALSARVDIPKHRIGVNAKEMILFFGPSSEMIVCCDPYSRELYSVAPPLVDLSSQDYKCSTIKPLIACATPENNLYLACHLSKHFWMYNPAQNSWQELAERPLARIRSARMGYLNGHVYILGGRNPVTDAPLREVECYSVQRNQWRFVAPLPHSPGKMQVVALNEQLYVVNKRRMLCYDPRSNQWRHCGSVRRGKLHKPCVFQDQIICVCDIPVVKAYSPTRGEWKRMGDIPVHGRALNYQVVQLSGKLLLLTQIFHEQQHNKNRVLIHEYDPGTDSWKNVIFHATVHVFSRRSVCVSTRVYPACLGSAQSFPTEEDAQDGDHGSSYNWGWVTKLAGREDRMTDDDSGSGSSS